MVSLLGMSARCSRSTPFSFIVIRRHTSSVPVPVLHIPQANVYRFGDPNTAQPVFRDVRWTIHENEAWAIVGSGSGEKTTLFQTLLGHLRISPPPPSPGGLFPLLSTTGRDPFKTVSIVSFGNRRSASGTFYDYTAKYGAVREEDKVTLRQTMFPETIPPEFGETTTSPALGPISEEKIRLFETLVDKMDLKELLDIPMVALSNGQTRRARIVKAVLGQPELLLLDEPLTGLDIQNRPKLLQLLHALHATSSPRVIVGLRTQDEIPEWITHVAFVRNGRVATGHKEEILAMLQEKTVKHLHQKAVINEGGSVLVDLKDVNVKYGPRTVLRNITWKIRQGERWHLQGTNGSGKTTLLSLLTGDHPQSWTQSHLHLPSPSNSTTSRFSLLPRKKIPTPHLQSCIGVVSPELFDAFPRRNGMSVWEAVGTGFDGGFVPLGKERVGGLDRSSEEREWRVKRCWETIEALGPASWTGRLGDGHSSVSVAPSEAIRAFAAQPFSSLPAGPQRMVLLMRALVGEPALVLLDEVWSGMDEGMVQAARRHLRERVRREQAVIVITHWEEEVPWSLEEGLKQYLLEQGEGRIRKKM